MNELIIFEVYIQNKTGYKFSFCRLPSKTHGKFEDCLIDFEHVLCVITARNPLFVLLTSNFSAKAAMWWRNNMTNSDHTTIDSLTTSYDLSQIISAPT